MSDFSISLACHAFHEDVEYKWVTLHLAFIRMKQEFLKKLKYFLEKVLLLEWNKRKTQMAIRFFCCRAISKTNWNLPRFPPTCFAQTKVRKICCINCSCFDLPLGMVIWNAKILVIVYLIWSTRQNRLHTGIPRLVRPRTIKLTTFLVEKHLYFFWQFLEILGIFKRAIKTWFEIAIALINYVYLPKSIQKFYKCVNFHLMGRTIRGERYKWGSLVIRG